LNAAVQGDLPILRQTFEELSSNVNINCVDYMGRSALHLAVDSECLEAVELLLEK
jgi:ankyrin repeat protein